MDNLRKQLTTQGELIGTLTKSIDRLSNNVFIKLILYLLLFTLA